MFPHVWSHPLLFVYVCICVQCPPFMRTSVMSDQSVLSWLHLNLILFAKSLFPNKVPFWGTGWGFIALVFMRHNSTHNSQWLSPGLSSFYILSFGTLPLETSYHIMRKPSGFVKKSIWRGNEPHSQQPWLGSSAPAYQLWAGCLGSWPSRLSSEANITDHVLSSPFSYCGWAHPKLCICEQNKCLFILSLKQQGDKEP